MTESHSWYVHHARVAALSRSRKPDDPIDDYIARLVDQAPPLTNEQCDRIAILLGLGQVKADV